MSLLYRYQCWSWKNRNLYSLRLSDSTGCQRGTDWCPQTDIQYEGREDEHDTDTGMYITYC